MSFEELKNMAADIAEMEDRITLAVWDRKGQEEIGGLVQRLEGMRRDAQGSGVCDLDIVQHHLEGRVGIYRDEGADLLIARGKDGAIYVMLGGAPGVLVSPLDADTLQPLCRTVEASPRAAAEMALDGKGEFI